MDQLTKLAIKYGTDKWGKHHYTPFYYDLFKNRRSEVKKVLEIGVGEGSSLRMWRDFFPNAMIYGADIDPTRVFKEDRIEVVVFDQRDPGMIRKLVDKYFSGLDLVIDDGSHDPLDQIFTCLGVMSISDGNLTYVIEDVADPRINDFLTERYSSQVIECGKRYDDRLIVVRKN